MEGEDERTTMLLEVSSVVLADTEAAPPKKEELSEAGTMG